MLTRKWTRSESMYYPPAIREGNHDRYKRTLHNLAFIGVMDSTTFGSQAMDFLDEPSWSSSLKTGI